MANWLGPMGCGSLYVQGTKPRARTLPKECSESWGRTTSGILSTRLSTSSQRSNTHHWGNNSTATYNNEGARGTK